MKVVLIQDDVDAHGAGCTCGDCNSSGQSYGVSIYTYVPQYNEEGEELDDPDYLEEQLVCVYGPSEEAAEEIALRVAAQMGVEVV